jgi:hypothetical protein
VARDHSHNLFDDLQIRCSARRVGGVADECDDT